MDAAGAVEPPAPPPPGGGRTGFAAGVTVAVLVLLGAAAWIGFEVWRQRALRADVPRIMQSLGTAQEQFKQNGEIDQDDSNWGEYAWLGELAALDRGRRRQSDEMLIPYVSIKFQPKDSKGRSRLHRHLVQGLLPVAGGNWEWEAAQIAAEWEAANAEAQSKAWRCYAWPVDGKGRTYYIDQEGELYATEARVRAYSEATRPAWNAADPADAEAGRGTGTYTGIDGNTWMPAGVER